MYIVLYGLSGSGKTTLSDGLINSGRFSTCKMSVTRPPRMDDTSGSFEYLSVSEYLKLRKEDSFALDADDGERYYGYQWCHLNKTSKKIQILFGCPQSVFSSLTFSHLNILIEGEEEKGLEKRGNAKITTERKIINASLRSCFFERSEFRKKMHIILHNSFYDGNDAREKVNAWIKKQGLQIFFRCQIFLARSCMIAESAAWVTTFYAHFNTALAELKAKKWGRYTCSLGWMAPLLDGMVFAEGKPILSCYVVAKQIFAKNDPTKRRYFIYFIFKLIGESPFHSLPNSIWEKKIRVLFLG